MSPMPSSEVDRRARALRAYANVRRRLARSSLQSGSSLAAPTMNRALLRQYSSGFHSALRHGIRKFPRPNAAGEAQLSQLHWRYALNPVNDGPAEPAATRTLKSGAETRRDLWRDRRPAQSKFLHLFFLRE